MSEFYVDFAKLNKETEKMNAPSGAWFSQKAIPLDGEVDIRMLPPLKSSNGSYYLEQISVWINGINYVSPKTFGKDKQCPILDFVEAAKEEGDDEISALIASKEYNEKTEFVLPILLLDTKTGEVIGDEAKLMKVTYSIIKQLNNFVTHRHYQNGTPLGIFDRELGHNITISKKKENDFINYLVQPVPQPVAMDAKYYDKVPDVVEIITKQLYSYEYLQGVVLNYFYGEPMPDESLKFKKGEDEDSDEPEAKTEPVKETKAPVKEEAKVEPEPVAKATPKATPKVSPPKEDSQEKPMTLLQKLKQGKKG